MKPNLSKILKVLLLLTISGALLYFAFRRVNLVDVLQGILGANMGWVALSGLISVMAFFVRSYRWNLLIEPLRYSPSLKNSTAALMIGYLANLAIPRLGEVSRCAVLNRTDAVPFNKLLGTVIVERVIDVISLFVCLLLAAIIEYKRLGDFLKEKMLAPLFDKTKLLMQSPWILAGLIFLTIVIVATLTWLYRNEKRKKKDSWILKIINGFVDGLRSVGNLKRPGLFIFHSILIWVLYFLGVYVALFSLPATSGLGMNAGLFLLVAGGFGMSAPVQGGLGAYHFLVSQGLVLYGLTELEGLTFATMVHGLQILLIIVMSVAATLFILRTKRNQLKIR